MSEDRESKRSEVEAVSAADAERIRKRAAAEVGMQTIGLAVLVARAGGTVTIEMNEHEAARERYGGKLGMSMHMEIVKGPGEKRSLRFTLTRKPPGNAELVT